MTESVICHTSNSTTGSLGLQMKEFCDDRDTCRHAALLTYFGERLDGGRCGTNCDNCARAASGEAADQPDPEWLVHHFPYLRANPVGPLCCMLGSRGTGTYLNSRH